jgi:hypothetical protein
MGWTLPKGIWKNNKPYGFEYIDVEYTEYPPTAHIENTDNAPEGKSIHWCASAPCKLPIKGIKGKWLHQYALNFADARRIMKEGDWTKIK